MMRCPERHRLRRGVDRHAVPGPEVRERLARPGIAGTNMGPGVMTALVGRKVGRWHEMIRAKKVTPG